MTSDQFWERYNKVANELRERIATIAKEELENFYTSFYFKDRGKSNVFLGEDFYECIGLTYDEQGVQIIRKWTDLNNGDLYRDEVTLYHPDVNIVDLLEILQRIEH